MYELNFMNKSRTKLSFLHLRIQNVLIFLDSRMYLLVSVEKNFRSTHRTFERKAPKNLRAARIIEELGKNLKIYIYFFP